MNADERRWGQDQVTRTVIGCAYTVGNVMGCGFLEKVYENALAIEVRKQGLTVEPQRPIAVRYDGLMVGEFFADLLVAGELIVELKAVKALDEIHVAQCLNYLKATGLKVCLLINLGAPRVEVRRIVREF
jgi:GxxExxY protein